MEKSEYYCDNCNRLISKCICVTFEEKKDKVTEAVRTDLLSRSEIGIKKYGTTLDGNKGDERYWLQHAYEETLDLA